MACALDSATRSVAFRTADGSVFFVGSHGVSIDSIVSVQWRGVDLCADCFLDQLDDDERAELEANLQSSKAREL